MDTPLGWMFVGLAGLFSLGLLPRLAARFYPTRPGFATRSAAPVIFAGQALACFAGFATPVLVAVAALGTAAIVTRKRSNKVTVAAPESGG